MILAGPEYLSAHAEDHVIHTVLEGPGGVLEVPLNVEATKPSALA